MKLLVFEDNKFHQEILELQLKSLDKAINLTIVSHPDEGLAKIKEGPFDAVLLDYDMPQKNGLQVLAEIRAMKSDVPVVMLTGQGDEKIAVEAMKLMAYDYVTKPIDFGVLFRLLTKAIEINRREKELKKLKDEMLVQMKKQAILGNFFAGVAHEVNNNILAIMEIFAILKKNMEVEVKNSPSVQLIDNKISNSLGMLGNLLRVNDKYRLDFKYVNLRKFIDNVTGMHAPYFEKNNIRVIKKHNNEEVEISCVESQLEQAFFNIILGLMPYLKDGELTFNTYKSEAAKMAEIRIKDNRGAIRNIFKDENYDITLAESIISFHKGEILTETNDTEGDTLIIKIPYEAS